MERVISCILLISLLAAASSASKEVYDGWVEEAVTYDVEGKPLFVSVTPDNEVIYVKYGDGTAGGIFNQSNETLDIYTIYYMGARHGRYDTVKDKEVLEYHVIIETNAADIRITKELNKELLYPNEEGVMSIRFENQGALPAERFNYIERYANFTLEEHSGCEIKNDTVVVSTEIVSEAEHVCRFYISDDEEREYEAQGDATYYNGLSSTSLTSPKTTIEVHKPELKGDINTSIEDIKVGDVVDINVTLFNTHETDPINTNNLVLSSSEGVETVKLNLRPHKIKEWVATENGNYKVEDWIPPETNKSFRIRVRFLKSGLQTITYSGTFEVVGAVRELDLTKVIDVRMDELDIYDNEEYRLDPGVPDDLPIFLGNRGGGDYSFRDITIAITSPDLNISTVREVESIGPKEFIPLFPDKIDVPEQAGSKNITVDIDMTYYSMNGERFNVRKKLNYTIAPLEQVIPEEINNTTNKTNETSQEDDGEGLFSGELSKTQIALIIIFPMIVIVAGLFLYHRHKKEYKNKYENLEFEIEYEDDDKKD